MLKKLAGILLLLLAACIIYVVLNAGELSKRYIYPVYFEEYVEKYSERNNIDKYFIYAVIKTESNFNENAESEVGARGLMQIMEEAFDWVKYRMKDGRDLTYDDMFKAEYNIEYGTYLIKLLYDEYKDEETALAAYHSGRGNVNGWLKDEQNSGDGKTLNEIPSKVTAHYVDKVMTAYNGYNNLYK